MWNEYYTQLKRIAQTIEHPNDEDIASVTPHLTPQQRAQILSSAKGPESAYFAIPPIKVLFGHWVASYSVYNDVPKLSLAFPKRTLKSYADGMPHGDIFYKNQFEDEAMAFAVDQWNDQLVLDTWVSYGKVYIDDPTDLNQYGYPKTKKVIHFTTSRDFTIVVNYTGIPRSEAWNNFLSEFSSDQIIGQELKGGRGGYTEFNCAYCGSGLGLRGCRNCGHTFTDNHIRCGGDTPLPPKMVALLEQDGHTFGMAPEIARGRETIRMPW